MKNIKLTKQQFNESLVRAIKLHESKRVVQQVVSETILKESRNSKLIERYLNEGPLSNVWQGIKDAGSAIGGMAGKAASKLRGTPADPIQPGTAVQPGPSQADVQAKSAVKHLTNLSTQVDKTRQKFQSELLKDTQVISDYYDGVINFAREVAKYNQQYGQGSLEMGKLVSLAQQKTQQLRDDLQEESEAIQSFLVSFEKDINRSQDEQDADESGRSSLGRDKAAMKTGKVK